MAEKRIQFSSTVVELKRDITRISVHKTSNLNDEKTDFRPFF